MAGLIRRRRAKTSLSNAELAAMARVDPGQTSRILDGKFRTISANVLRICNVLGIDPHGGDDATPKDVKAHAAWARLEASVRRAWDQTPQGAERLAAVIDAMAKVTSGKRGRKACSDASPAGNHSDLAES